MGYRLVPSAPALRPYLDSKQDGGPIFVVVGDMRHVLWFENRVPFSSLNIYLRLCT